jgi:hypothetical protein
MTTMTSMDDNPKDDSKMALVVVVVVQHEDSEGSLQSTKIRVRRSDLPHGEEIITGQILNRIIRNRCGTSSSDDGCSASAESASAELFDSNINTFCSLDHAEWRQCDLIQRIGTRRLRARIQRLPNSDQEQHQHQQRLAIQGRFYPYNGSLEIAGTTIQVDQQSNAPEEGTAGTVWDGAIML